MVKKNQESNKIGRKYDAERDNLWRTVLALRNLDEARAFFRDLLTESEIEEFARRWQAAQFLAKGVSYKEVARRTWLTPRTIARIKKWLVGGKGGYQLMINRMRRI